MRDGDADTCEHPREKTATNVWDTQYVPRRNAFSVYREAICKVFMPWSPEAKPGSEFHARVEALDLGRGSIGKLQLSPIIAPRTKQDIANSQVDCFYANYLVSGEVKVEQSGRANFLKPGDFVVYDGSLPVTLTTWDGPHYEILTFLIPKDRFIKIRNAEAQLNNVHIPCPQLIRPLSCCLTFLAHNMHGASKEELISIFDACVSLMPVATGCLRDREGGGEQAHYLLREIMEFVNQNIADANLSPQQAADHVGVSVRYVHKLFAASGTTFRSYVTARRLEHVRRDLLSPASRRQPISLVAYRWGFNDTSTFFRAFKKGFGCSPSRLRSTS